MQAPVKVSISTELPALRHILIKEFQCNPKCTWKYVLGKNKVMTSTLKMFNAIFNPPVTIKVNVDREHYEIMARNKKRSNLDDPISALLDFYKRKSSLCVRIVHNANYTPRLVPKRRKKTQHKVSRQNTSHSPIAITLSHLFLGSNQDSMDMEVRSGRNMVTPRWRLRRGSESTVSGNEALLIKCQKGK